MRFFDGAILIILAMTIVLELNKIQIRRWKFGKEIIRLKKKSFDYWLILWGGLFVLNAVDTAKKLRIDLGNEFSSYQNISDFFDSYNLVFLLLPIVIIFRQLSPYVIKEKGICYESSNWNWNRIKDFSWQEPDTLKLKVQCRFLWFKYKYAMNFYISNEQREDVQLLLDEYVEKDEM